MTATYTFDVFSSLDGYGSNSGDWGGYWGKQGPELLDRRLAVYDAEQRMVFGANTYRQFVRLLGSSTEESGVGDPWVARMKGMPATVVSTTLEGPLDWPDATAVVQVNREREVNGTNGTTTHYYISSYRGTARELGGVTRGHWGIENGLHWVLDLVFGEDASRTQDANAAANLAMVRKVAVALLKRAPGKDTTPTKRLRAGWDDEFLIQLLQGIPAI